MKSRHRYGVALLIAALAVGAAVLLTPLRHVGAARVIHDLQQIREHWWAIPAYIAAYAVFDIFFIPVLPLSIASALAWGWMKGGTIELAAATIGSILPWLIGRSAFRDRLLGYLERHRSLAALLDREGFSLLLLLRVVPIIPYTLLNYVAPLANIALPQYILATFLGVIPSTFIFAYFVDAIGEGVVRPWDVGIRIFAAGLLLAVLIIATRFAARRVQRTVEEKSRTS